MRSKKAFFGGIREALGECRDPLFFFDDDPDGLCAFIQCYRFVREGRGVVVKSHPVLGRQFLRKEEEHRPDRIVVLDVPGIEEDFVNEAKSPILWIDHHNGERPAGVRVFNPRDLGEDKLCTSATVYYAIKQDLWVAAIGSIADWTMPPLIREFKKKYPKLLPKEITKPEDALFASPAGRIARILSFLLKGRTSEVNKAVRVLTRIEEPEEILEGTTARGRFLLKRIRKTEEEYNSLMRRAKKTKQIDGVIVFKYHSHNTSFTNDLANELVYLNPDKLVIVGREKNSEVKMSLRSKSVELPGILQAALSNVRGYGGGHEHACGACVSKEDFERFLDNIARAYRKAKAAKKSS